MNHLVLLCLSLILISCATKPPVQAMAEARAAVQSVRTLYTIDASQKTVAYRFYQSAEESLKAATKALDNKKYNLAKQKAHQAKRQARMAAKLK